MHWVSTTCNSLNRTGTYFVLLKLTLSMGRDSINTIRMWMMQYVVRFEMLWRNKPQGCGKCALEQVATLKRFVEEGPNFNIGFE